MKIHVQFPSLSEQTTSGDLVVHLIFIVYDNKEYSSGFKKHAYFHNYPWFKYIQNKLDFLFFICLKYIKMITILLIFNTIYQSLGENQAARVLLLNINF